MRALLILALACPLWADELTKQVTQRLAEEADAFQRLAPKLLGKETLHQKALKPPPRFHPRVGEATKQTVMQFRQREVISEYAYASFGGDDPTIHEMRRVITAEGKPVEDAKKAQQMLAKVITSSDQERKKQLLKDFEKYGLTGAVTDFGQIILLFTPRNIGRFEFFQQGSEMLGTVRTLVFNYKQIDGPESVTLFDENHHDTARGMKAQGQVWVRADTYLPVRISMVVTSGEDKAAIREEAAVNYELSRFGVLLPSSTTHRELRGGNVYTENDFVYSDFHKFGAESGVSFEVEKVR